MINEWLKEFQSRADTLVQKNAVQALDFSGPTYQIEILDPNDKKYYYPFLQLEQNGVLKDSFCDCSHQGEGCLHLATAYQMIFAKHTSPWHARFETSFYKRLAALYADRIGFDEINFQKEKKGIYTFTHQKRSVLLEVNDPKTIEKIEAVLFNPPRATPENSIKFSNLSQEQIQHWREGRADPWLRFELSLWADLMKYLFWKQQLDPKASLIFTEKENSPPTEAVITFKTMRATFTFTEEDLLELIPSLEMQNSSLALYTGGERILVAMHFDPQKKLIRLEHREKRSGSRQGIVIGKWLYQPTIGFTAPLEDSMLEEAEIPAQEISTFLTTHLKTVQKFLETPLIPGKKSLKHHLFFDKKWNLHIDAYLFEIGDLQKKSTCHFNNWFYLEEKGFIQVDGKRFTPFTLLIEQEKVSSFVSEQRIWLSDQKGFSTHLAALESSLTYTVDNEARLHFLSEAIQEMEAGSFDFGEWVYYKERGFFAKRRAKIGLHVRPNLHLHPNGIERFIKENGEELENVKGFFSNQMPLVRSSLIVEVTSLTSLDVKPLYTFLPEYSECNYHFYGEYLYVEGNGFSLLPMEMRLPEEFREAKSIHKDELAHFITEQLPKLLFYIDMLPVECQVPRKCDLEVHYLVRMASGSLKAEFFYVTEHGRINSVELFQALEKGQRFLFSQAGLLDLKQDSFSWLKEKGLKIEGDSFLLSTLDFMRLDAREGLLLYSENSVISEVSAKLLTSLRHFSIDQGFDIKGLKSNLRLYQETGLKWLWFLYSNGLSGLLCDDMGLGKTHQAMALIAAISNLLLPKKALFLVVCPTSVIYHWQDKLAAFLPHLRVQMFHGLKRKLVAPEAGGVIVTTYGIVRLQKELFANLEIDLAIYDEIQLAKNPKSGIHKGLKEVKARMHLGLTGTPIENNLLELKALFDLVLPGYLPKESLFKSQYLNPIERDNNEEKKSQLIKLIKPFSLRRRKSEVLQELPSKSEDKIYCDLSEEQQKIYRDLLEERKRTLVEALKNPEEKVPYMHIFSLLSALKQICNHPALYLNDVEHYKKYQSSKWELFEELLAEALESGQKVVIFSQYLQMLDIMEAYLREKHIGYAQIRGDTQDRRKQLETFQGDEECKVFLGSLQAAGLGIDLTAASVVIMYDRWWNLARESQAIDRVHRMGQKWGVQVYTLITKDTIEERIDQMIMKKGKLMEEIVTVDDQSTLKSLSRSELIELLT